MQGGPLGTCGNPHEVDVLSGSQVRLEDIDTCESLNSNDGDGNGLTLWTLQGKDYIVRLSPQPAARIVTAETLPTAARERFDTYLMATRICTKTRQAGQWVG